VGIKRERKKGEGRGENDVEFLIAPRIMSESSLGKGKRKREGREAATDLHIC